MKTVLIWWGTRPRPNVFLVFALAILLTLVTTIVGVSEGTRLLVFANVIAMFLTIGVFGGTLRADLRNLVGTGAALVVGVGLPLVLSPVSLWLGGAVVVMSIAVVSFLPSLGSRYILIAQGICLSTLYAFTYQHTRAVPSSEIMTGVSAAFVVVLFIRVLGGISDPSGPLRENLANALATPSLRAAEKAAVIWTRGPATTWTKDVLRGILQFTTAREVLTCTTGPDSTDNAKSTDSTKSTAGVVGVGSAAELVSRADRVAAAASIHLRKRAVAADAVVSGELDDALHALEETAAAHRSRAGDELLDGLRVVVGACLNRTSAQVKGMPGARRLYTRTILAGVLSPATPPFRHAVRLLVALSIALIVGLLWLPAAFAPTLAMTVYGVLQLSWGDTLKETRRRLLGVVLGGGIGGTAAAMLPPAWLPFIAIPVLVVGFAYVSSSITVLMACLVITLTLALAPTLSIEPGVYALSYVGTVAGGALLATVFAFAFVPLPSPRTAALARQHAERATAELLTAVARHARPASVRRALIRAYRANQLIVPRRQPTQSNLASSLTPADPVVDPVAGAAGPADSGLTAGMMDPQLRAHDVLADLNLICFLTHVGVFPPTPAFTEKAFHAATTLESVAARTSRPTGAHLEDVQALRLPLLAAAVDT